jgi:hypothetical protein
MKPLAVLIALALTGCGTQPEQMHMAIAKPASKSCITEAMVGAGWRIRQESEHQVIFSKRGDDVFGAIIAQFGDVATFSFVGGRANVDVVRMLNIDSPRETPSGQRVDAKSKATVNRAMTQC